MRSLILQTIALRVLPMTVLFAAYLLGRGHDRPGGGFVAGLVASAAIVLLAFAFGADDAERWLTARLRPAAWLGLAVAIATGLAGPVAAGDPVLTHYHATVTIVGEKLHVSTTLAFDAGVFLVVLGATATVLWQLLHGTPRSFGGSKGAGAPRANATTKGRPGLGAKPPRAEQRARPAPAEPAGSARAEARTSSGPAVPAIAEGR